MQYDNHGETDDDFLDVCKTRRDIRPRREEIMRDGKSLHLRRATIINHESIVEKRELKRQKNCNVQLNKMQEENTKHREKINTNRDAVWKVLKAAQEKGRLGEEDCLSDGKNLDFCSLEQFGVLGVPLLKAFIVAHDDKLMRMKGIPNKGNVKEAVKQGVHNAISMAHKCRMKPNLLEGKYPHSEEDLAKFADGGNDDEDECEVNMTTVRLGESYQVKPSELLGCPVWMATTVRLF